MTDSGSDNLRADKYTPTTEQVRNNMALGVTMAHFMPEDAANVDFPAAGWREEAKADFDRWFGAVVERRVAEATAPLEAKIAAVIAYLDEDKGAWAPDIYRILASGQEKGKDDD